MKIFLSGIGGIGMSAYAAIMKQQGHDVSGSDVADSVLLADLRAQGIAIALKQDGAALQEGTDLLVYSEAIPEDSKERTLARERGITEKPYFAALGELTKDTDLIAVCGTHGKSSTTAMIAHIFIEAGLDPSVVVGTKVPQMGNKNWRIGSSKLWIVEACEYKNSFLSLNPSEVVLTNVDGDHFDAFSSLESYREAFTKFVSQLPTDGKVITHGLDEDAVAIVKKAGKVLVDADDQAPPEMSIPGLHMRQNAQLALALAVNRGIDSDVARKALTGFTGTWRRMEVLGDTNNAVTVIDDYAHHPTEIRASISGIREKYGKRRLVCVYEPHTHDRTLKLWKEFAESFSEADLVLVTKVYDARPDRESEKVDVAKLAAEIGRTCKVASRPSGSLEKTKKALEEMLLHHGDVLLVMGAGKSTRLAHAMVE